MASFFVILALFSCAAVPVCTQDPTESSAILVEARDGDTVTLPCDQVLPTPAPDFPVALFILQWQRQDIARPFYVLFDSADPIISPPYDGRVSLEDGGSALTITDVTAADAGIYECQLIELGNIENIENGTFVNLVILGPPEFISTPADHVVFQENQEASLQCIADAVPTPVITWYRQGEPLLSTNRVTVSGDSIFIRRVVRGDGGTYSCQAENSEGRVVDTTRFVVEGAPYIFVPPVNSAVTLGQSATLTCEAMSSPSNLTHRWFFEGTVLQAVSHLSGRAAVSAAGELVIRATQLLDRGTYTCSPTNGLGTPPEASAFLDVQYAAEVVAMPTEVYSTHGEAAVIPCNTTANPPLLYVIWRKDETEIRITQTNRYSTTKDGSLVIDDASVTDEGSYTCTPYNDLGTAGQSTPTTLHVIDPPSFAMEPEPSYQQSVGSSVFMPCSASGNPPPSLTWRKVNGQLSSRTIVTSTRLRIDNIRKEDHGTYQCLVANQVATAMAETDLIVSPTSPHTPTNVTVVTSSTSAYISWTPGYNGDRTQTFTLRYREFASTSGLWTSTLRLEERVHSMLIYDLQPSTTYEFTVTANNELGTSGPSDPVVALTKDADIIVHPTDSSGATVVPLPEDIKPSPPRNVTLVTSDEGLFLSWRAPSRWASYVDHYAIEYRITGPWVILEDRIAPDVGSAAGDGTSVGPVALEDLQPNTTYQFRVFAFTLTTYSDPSATVEGDTRGIDVYIPVPTSLPRSSMSSIIAGVIAGLCFLLVALLLFTMAIVISHRKKEKKKRFFFDPVRFLHDLQQQGSENSFPSTSSGREDQPLTAPSSRHSRERRRQERGDYVYYHGQMLLTALSSDDEPRVGRDDATGRDAVAMQAGEWGSQPMQTFGHNTPPRYTHPPEKSGSQVGRTPDSRSTSLWTEDVSGVGTEASFNRQMHRHSTRKDLQAARAATPSYANDVPRMQALSPSALDSMSTIAGSVSGRSITPTPMEFQEYPTGASYEYTSQQQPSPEVPHPRKTSPYKDMMRVNAEVYSDPSIVSVSPLGSRDYTSADYGDPYDTDTKSPRLGSYVHSDVFSPAVDERTFPYSDDGYHASQDFSDYQRTQSLPRGDESNVRLPENPEMRPSHSRSTTPRAMSPRAMSPRAMSPRAMSPRSPHWRRSPSTHSYHDPTMDSTILADETMKSRDYQMVSPVPSQHGPVTTKPLALSPSAISNSRESFSSVEGPRDQSLVGPLPSFAPRRTLSPISQHSLSSGYGSRNTSQSTTNTSSTRGRRSFPSMEEVREEGEENGSPVSDTKRDDSTTDENEEGDRGLDSELMEALKRYYEPEKIIVDSGVDDDVTKPGKIAHVEKRCEELKKEFEEYRKKQALIEEEEEAENKMDISREVYKPFKLTSTV
ncbi:protein turtle homolog A-like [Diadema setosum]|uniref:protein turtle homolog A-like n=1 Tax=Diadema setosum TaxID=31175 RepID=UPI003B3A38E4